MNKSLLATRSGLTLLAAILALSSMLVRPVPANAYTAHHLCTAGADQFHCTNLKGGVVQAGTRIIMWWYGVKQSDFVEHYEGTSSATSRTPAGVWE